MSNFFSYRQRKQLLIAGASVVAMLSLAACTGTGQGSEPVESVAPTMTTSAAQADDVQWGYEGEGAPENWGELDPDYEMCGIGMEQSPVDLVSADLEDLPDLVFDYVPSSWSVTNNGHTVQVTPDQPYSMELDGRDNTLLQMHLHTPSEHLVGGESFDAEAHFVHSDSDDQLTVVGVLFEEAAPNPIIEQLLAEAPSTVDEVVQVEEEMDLSTLLPESREYNTYSGSLTTPPCSEDVTWIVYTQPISASMEQITDLNALMGTNSRPVQDLNDRDIKDDSTVG